LRVVLYLAVKQSEGGVEVMITVFFVEAEEEAWVEAEVPAVE
jgi:hypothetical protein